MLPIQKKSGTDTLKDNTMSHKKHHVNIHKWVQGILHTVKHEFESLEEALHFTKTHQDEHNNTVHAVETTQVVKVYDEDGTLVYSTDGGTDTYA